MYKNNFHIVIDNYNFKIISKHSGKLNYEFVLIESNHIKNPDEKKKFSLYRSKSELDFLRLGYLSSDKFYKGFNDYVQQTFINIKLQKYINEVFDKLDNINTKDEKGNNRPEKEINEELNLNDINIKQSIDGTENNSRMKSIYPFNENNEKKCGIKIPQNELINSLQELSIKIENEFKVSDKTTHIYEYKKEKYNINNLKEFYVLNVYSVDLIPRNNNNNNKTLKLFYYIANFCFYDKTSFLKSTNKDYSWQNFYKLNKKIKNEYNHKECLYNDVYIPLFLTTINSKINEYGLYNIYIPAGNYICKFLDYAKQCSQEEKNKICSYRYVFIADRYYNLYPFNKIANTVLIKMIIENKNIDDIKEFIESFHLHGYNSEKEIINEINNNSLKSPLYYAIDYNRLDIIKLLIDKGSKIEYKLFNYNILIYISKYGTFEVLDLIIKRLKNINQIDIDNQIDINQIDIFKKSSLFYAIKLNKIKIIKYLLKKYQNKIDSIEYINTSIKNNNYEIDYIEYINISIKNNNYEIYELLLRYYPKYYFESYFESYQNIYNILNNIFQLNDIRFLEKLFDECKSRDVIINLSKNYYPAAENIYEILFKNKKSEFIRFLIDKGKKILSKYLSLYLVYNKNENENKNISFFEAILKYKPECINKDENYYLPLVQSIYLNKKKIIIFLLDNVYKNIDNKNKQNIKNIVNKNKNKILNNTNTQKYNFINYLLKSIENNNSELYIILLKFYEYKIIEKYKLDIFIKLIKLNDINFLKKIFELYPNPSLGYFFQENKYYEYLFKQRKSEFINILTNHGIKILPRYLSLYLVFNEIKFTEDQNIDFFYEIIKGKKKNFIEENDSNYLLPLIQSIKVNKINIIIFLFDYIYTDLNIQHKRKILDLVNEYSHQLDPLNQIWNGKPTENNIKSNKLENLNNRSKYIYYSIHDIDYYKINDDTKNVVLEKVQNQNKQNIKNHNI